MQMDKETVNKAIANIPDVEIEYLKQLSPADTITDNQRRWLIASVRLQNPICNYCRRKNGKLSLCKCKLVWYCTERDCRKQDAKAHNQWCCKKDAPNIEKGPMMTTALKLKK